MASPAICRASVVFPDCRGPQSSTTLVSARASLIRCLTKRGYMRLFRTSDYLKNIP